MQTSHPTLAETVPDPALAASVEFESRVHVRRVPSQVRWSNDADVAADRFLAAIRGMIQTLAAEFALDDLEAAKMRNCNAPSQPRPHQISDVHASDAQNEILEIRTDHVQQAAKSMMSRFGEIERPAKKIVANPVEVVEIQTKNPGHWVCLYQPLA